LIPICCAIYTPIDICIELPNYIDTMSTSLTINYDEYIIENELRE